VAPRQPAGRFRRVHDAAERAGARAGARVRLGRRLRVLGRVCPGNNESAGKRRSGRLRPGNPTLRVTLAECAHGTARIKGTQFQGYHGALQARLGYKKVILAVTHKLLRVVYAVLRDLKQYRHLSKA